MIEIFKQIEEMQNDIIQFRRHFHKNPEIGFETKNTELYIRDFLHKNNIEILPIKTGVVGRIKSVIPTDKSILLRADIDALPIEEENNKEYCSVNKGMMHACGHDGHAAMLMGTAKILNDNRELLKHNVLLVFQPAEEGPAPGGAKIVIDEMRKNGYLDHVKFAYGQHVATEYDTGKIALFQGNAMASCDDFEIEIVGKGGHAALQHSSVDAISVASKFIQSMESYMGRFTNPFIPTVFSVGTISGGTALNAIAQRVTMTGTIRTLDENSRHAIPKQAEKILESICKSFGAEGKIKIIEGLPVLYNHSEPVKFIGECVLELLGSEKVIFPTVGSMGSEDFAYFSMEFPSAFAFIGAKNEEKGFTQLAHNPSFDFDEDALLIGTKLMCMVALKRVV